MIETLVHDYSLESTQRELSNEYQNIRVELFFKSLWSKVTSALEGLPRKSQLHLVRGITKTVMLLGQGRTECFNPLNA